MDNFVRLDELQLPKGANAVHARDIAEALLHICGFVEVWDEPTHGHRIFRVRTKPEDVPQAGIHWITVDMIMNPYT